MSEFPSNWRMIIMSFWEKRPQKGKPVFLIVGIFLGAAASIKYFLAGYSLSVMVSLFAALIILGFYFFDRPPQKDSPRIFTKKDFYAAVFLLFVFAPNTRMRFGGGI
jgi:hypothetical protein